MNKLVVGDVVMLKSGGPRMTVKSNNGSSVFCQWFGSPSDGEPLKDGHFAEDALKKVEE